ncbi:MAG: T9SS type A sorting domain-containing protein, partial [Flavobacteriales bacterium]|nr:T9SS type A sorting domain-containing protein [Flavobacteriales bacterium]
NPYDNSDVWVAPLMDMYFDLGKDITDKLVLHTITALDVNTTMEQAALIMMSMDTLYNNHENSMVIFNTFKKYCILNDGHLSSDEYSMSRFKIINSQAFAQGGEMIIDFGYLLTGEIKVYDINGVNIFNKIINQKKNFNFSSENLNSGIYLINVITNDGSRTIKVCKY